MAKRDPRGEPRNRDFFSEVVAAGTAFGSRRGMTNRKSVDLVIYVKNPHSLDDAPISATLTPIYPANGSTLCTAADRREASCSIWIRV